jgi:hypothetical protein
MVKNVLVSFIAVSTLHPSFKMSREVVAGSLCLMLPGNTVFPRYSSTLCLVLPGNTVFPRYSWPLCLLLLGNTVFPRYS